MISGTEHEHHIVPVKTYVATLFTLLFLMALTVAISFVHLGSIGNNLIAMTIAIIKASLVVMIFMGVRYSTKLTQLWAATGFIWLFLLGIILADYYTRSRESIPTGFYKDAGSSLTPDHSTRINLDDVPNLRPRQ